MTNIKTSSKLTPTQARALGLIKAVIANSPRQEIEFEVTRGMTVRDGIALPSGHELLEGNDAITIRAVVFRSLIRKGYLEKTGTRTKPARPTRRNFAGVMGFTKGADYIKCKLAEGEGGDVEL